MVSMLPAWYRRPGFILAEVVAGDLGDGDARGAVVAVVLLQEDLRVGDGPC